jgi:hypothetical protein
VQTSCSRWIISTCLSPPLVLRASVPRSIWSRPDLHCLFLAHDSPSVSLDRNFHVRPDSHVTLSAIRSVVSEEGFDDLLDSVMDRISAIESLGRTRELFLKQPVKVERLGRKGLRLTGLDPEEEEEKERKEKEKGGGGWRLFG